MDPELVSYTVDDPPLDATSGTKYFTVTDHMDAMPRSLYDAKVSFKAEITEIEGGIKWVIKAPLGLVQTSIWIIEGEEEENDGGEKGVLSLVENVSISCSRLLMGTVKGKCEANWKGIHGRFADRLKNETAGSSPP
jgi:hypothetical protein